MRTSPLQSVDEDREGAAESTGVDLRWTYSGVQLRGEWITGRPFKGASTSGWYADGFVHLAAMGPVTAVARIEQLDFEDPSEAEESLSRRQTIGARGPVAGRFSVDVNPVPRHGDLKTYAPAPF